MSESQYFQDCLLDAARSSALAEVEAVLHAGRSMVGSVLQASDPKTGATALHFAASTCDLPVGRCLLRAGHAPDACDKYGKTPLHYACARGHDAFVALLIGAESGGGHSHHDAHASEVVAAAASSPTHRLSPTVGRRRRRSVFAEGGDDAGGGGFGRVIVPETLRRTAKLTPLQLAARGNHAGCVRLLLAAGFVPDEANEAAETALHHAAACGATAAARVLLDAGAAPDAKTRERSDAPLHYAACRGHAEVGLLLARHGGADCFVRNAPPRGGPCRTPLETAVDCGHPGFFNAVMAAASEARRDAERTLDARMRRLKERVAAEPEGGGRDRLLARMPPLVARMLEEEVTVRGVTRDARRRSVAAEAAAAGAPPRGETAPAARGGEAAVPRRRAVTASASASASAPGSTLARRAPPSPKSRNWDADSDSDGEAGRGGAQPADSSLGALASWGQGWGGEATAGGFRGSTGGGSRARTASGAGPGARALRARSREAPTRAMRVKMRGKLRPRTATGPELGTHTRDLVARLLGAPLRRS